MRKPFRECAVEGCYNEHYGLGYCRMHYYRFKRNGDPLKVRVPASQVFLKSDSLKRPDLNDAQLTNICAIFSGIRA